MPATEISNRRLMASLKKETLRVTLNFIESNKKEARDKNIQIELLKDLLKNNELYYGKLNDMQKHLHTPETLRELLQKMLLEKSRFLFDRNKRKSIQDLFKEGVIVLKNDFLREIECDWEWGYDEEEGKEEDEEAEEEKENGADDKLAEATEGKLGASKDRGRQNSSTQKEVRPPTKRSLQPDQLDERNNERPSKRPSSGCSNVTGKQAAKPILPLRQPTGVRIQRRDIQVPAAQSPARDAEQDTDLVPGPAGESAQAGSGSEAASQLQKAADTQHQGFPHHQHGIPDMPVEGMIPRTRTAVVPATNDESNFATNGSDFQARPSIMSAGDASNGSLQDKIHAGTALPPEEVNTFVDFGTIESTARLTFSNVQGAVRSIIRENNIKDNAPAEYVFENTPAGLEELYRTLFGTVDWRGQVVRLGNVESTDHLSAVEVLWGLVGASIHKVFAADFPWDIAVKLNPTEVLGCPIKYSVQAMRELGSSVQGVAKRIHWLQIHDPDFQDTTISQEARKLACNLVLNITPHLQRATRTMVERAQRKAEWLPWLEDAFKKALILKQEMSLASNATFQAIWFPTGSTFCATQHESGSENQEPGKIILTLFPGIRAVANGDRARFAAKAEVLVATSTGLSAEPTTGSLIISDDQEARFLQE